MLHRFSKLQHLNSKHRQHQQTSDMKIIITVAILLAVSATLMEARSAKERFMAEVRKILEEEDSGKAQMVSECEMIEEYAKDPSVLLRPFEIGMILAMDPSLVTDLPTPEDPLLELDPNVFTRLAVKQQCVDVEGLVFITPSFQLKFQLGFRVGEKSIQQTSKAQSIRAKSATEHLLAELMDVLDDGAEMQDQCADVVAYVPNNNYRPFEYGMYLAYGDLLPTPPPHDAQTVIADCIDTTVPFWVQLKLGYDVGELGRPSN